VWIKVSEEREELKAIDIMSSPVYTISPTSTVYEAAKIMADNNVGSLVVVEGTRPIGIVTKGDLVKKVLAKGRNPASVVVGEIMSTPLLYVEPTTPILEVAKIMARSNIRHLPVIEGQKLLGIVTDRDILSVAPTMIEVLTVKRGRS